MNKLYPISVIKPTFFSNQSVVLLLLLLFAFASAKTFAQQKKEYTLLWRISGNGLQQPSYLFGTMHVKDKRVFGFSDSVMLAIQKSSAFALEVHPDTIIKKMFITLQSRDTSRNLRSLLGKEDYDKLAQRFEKKNGFPMGDIDPIQAESMIQPEAEKADDRSGPKQGSRYMLFFTNNMLYCLYAGNRLAVLNEPYANRFFNSFKAFRVAPAANKSWITLKNDTAAFSINLPGKPQSFEKLVSAKQGSSIKLKMYMAIDTVNFENYLVRYSNYAAGSYVENAENSFDAIVEEYKTNGIQILSSKKISKDGIPGRDITMIIKKVNCRAQLFCRGNRIYILLKQNLREGTALRQQMIFSVLSPLHPTLKACRLITILIREISETKPLQVSKH